MEEDGWGPGPTFPWHLHKRRYVLTCGPQAVQLVISPWPAQPLYNCVAPQFCEAQWFAGTDQSDPAVCCMNNSDGPGILCASVLCPTPRKAGPDLAAESRDRQEEPEEEGSGRIDEEELGED